MDWFYNKGIKGMNELTQSQLKTVKTIEHLKKEKGVNPSMREIASHLGVTVPVVFRAIETLQNKGYLSRKKEQKRTTILTEKSVELIANEKK